MKTALHTPFWLRLLTHLNNREDYASNIAKHLNTTYSHTVKVGHELKRRRMLTVTRVGRVSYWELTERGQEYAAAAEKLVMLVNDIKRRMR